MNKTILNIMMVFIAVSAFCLIGCQNEVEKIVYVDKTADAGQGGVTPQTQTDPQGNTKITSLQAAINSAKPNDVIDLTDPKYSEITTIERLIIHITLRLLCMSLILSLS